MNKNYFQQIYLFIIFFLSSSRAYLLAPAPTSSKVCPQNKTLCNVSIINKKKCFLESMKGKLASQVGLR